VARAAGVSQSTVSNVLNRPELVAPPTRDRVRAAMRSFGFVVDDGARRLRGGRSLTLAVSVLDVSNPFWGEVTRGVAEYAAERGYVVALGSTGASEDRLSEYLRVFEQQRVACLLAAPVGTDLKPLTDLDERGIPVVLLDSGDPTNRLPFVAPDHVQGGFLAGDFLLQSGHRRIGCITGPHTRWPDDRGRGVQLAVEKHGLDPANVLIQAPVIASTSAEGLRATHTLLRSGQRFTAIFCSNDILALGALRALNQAGILVPDEVSLVGYDDSAFSEMLSPPLTTVRQEPYRLGQVAAELALQIVSGTTPTPRTDALAPRLVVRESTAPARI
jgi:LacI family transcriptional regulator